MGDWPEERDPDRKPPIARSKKAKAKPKKKPRRVVLGVGHPWFLHDVYGTRSMVWLCASEAHGVDQGLTLDYKDLGAYNKIRLVAEVLK